MFYKKFQHQIVVFISVLALPILGTQKPIMGPYKPARPSSVAPDIYKNCMKFEKEISKYEEEVKKLKNKNEQEKLMSETKAKKKNNSILNKFSKSSKKSQDALDRSNPAELASHYKELTEDAREKLQTALGWKDQNTDPECVRRLEWFNIIANSKTRYRKDIY